MKVGDLRPVNGRIAQMVCLCRDRPRGGTAFTDVTATATLNLPQIGGGVSWDMG